MIHQNQSRHHAIASAICGPNSSAQMMVHAVRSVIAGVLVAAILSPALAVDNGQWSDVPAATREWFKSVRAPSGVPCCDISDGHRTQWEIRGQGYWVPNPRDEHGEWLQVPPESIVYNAGNPTGDAVVWWVPYATLPGGVFIRCFVPGGGV
jgi:hypothetical protein